MSVLRYITNETTRFHIFVSNNVSTIHEGSEVSRWRYMNTKLNPADDVSRGLIITDFIKCKQWVTAPGLLWSPESEWPGNQVVLERIHDEDPEVKKLSDIVLIDEQSSFMSSLISLFSSWMSLKRTENGS
ncbi:uncharacterized protein LOC102807653 [Saccoglossus kowalevskii]|uniref:Uncharacterized protein LOC102807653 n=1 Tax=Saccoglossus kowalevskii TaxID=10224 RepID=A0ABM0MCM7_SACKO|nr:PREDICTED: uncharacterized protein LOC102807653 [Saccoglossus kowalevskii]